MRRQKDIERHYLDEARLAATSVFPGGTFEPSERPDFVLSLNPRALGIEMTELCQGSARAAGARLRYVLPEARRLYDRRPDAKPVFVNFALAPNLEVGTTVKQLSAGLADFVYEHRNHYGSFSWDEEALPDGFCHIAEFSPNEDGRWFHSAGSRTELVGPELILASITEKNERLAEYRKATPDVWLLIVNDLFLGAGEVCVRLDEIARSTFDFGFDKVLLFERQPGGSGKVIELRRAAARAA